MCPVLPCPEWRLARWSPSVPASRIPPLRKLARLTLILLFCHAELLLLLVFGHKSLLTLRDRSETAAAQLGAVDTSVTDATPWASPLRRRWASASMPPQPWPIRWHCSRLSAFLTAASSSKYRFKLISAGSGPFNPLARKELPHPACAAAETSGCAQLDCAGASGSAASSNAVAMLAEGCWGSCSCP